MHLWAGSIMLCAVGRYTGEKLLDERVEVLLEAAWRPAPEGAFPDLPQSPRANGIASSASGPAAPQGYVAPHLRGTGACRPSSRRMCIRLAVACLLQKLAKAPGFSDLALSTGYLLREWDLSSYIIDAGVDFWAMHLAVLQGTAKCLDASAISATENFLIHLALMLLDRHLLKRWVDGLCRCIC